MKNSITENGRQVEGAYSAVVHRLAVLTACATLILIVAGGLVTSNDAGDSVPDWPLSFGQIVPWRHLFGNVVYEYGHRVVGAMVGLLTIILTIGLWRNEPRRWVRRVGLIALAAVVAQGTLGGMRVLLLEYRFPVAVIHACLGQLFFSLVVSLTVFTSRRWFEVSGAKSRGAAVAPSSVFYISAAATISIFLQLILGAAFRHRGIGIVPHIIGAALVTVMLGWAVVAVLNAVGSRPTIEDVKRRSVALYLTRPAIAAAVLLVVQLALGVGAYWIRLASLEDPQPLLPMVALTVAHVAVGALTLATAVALLLRLYHVMTPAGATIDFSSPPQRATS